MTSNLEVVARAIAERTVRNSPLAQMAWTEEQKREHVEVCWPEYAEMLEDGLIDEKGKILKPLVVSDYYARLLQQE